MIGLKQAAIAGIGIVALPGYVCRDELRSGALRRILPTWIAGDSTLTALMPFRHGLLPSVRAFIDHLTSEFPKVVATPPQGTWPSHDLRRELPEASPLKSRQRNVARRAHITCHPLQSKLHSRWPASPLQRSHARRRSRLPAGSVSVHARARRHVSRSSRIRSDRF
jgi:LysR substrate binding domain